MLRITETLDDRKQVLIELIEWYRDEWHMQDTFHSEMIYKIRAITSEHDLCLYEKIVDCWID